jgi:hypothetical protein
MPPALDIQDKNPGPNIRVRRPSLGALSFGLIPFLAVCFSVPLWDRVYPMVLGIPFNLFWLILWILVTPFCMLGAYRLERPKPEDRDRDSTP